MQTVCWKRLVVLFVGVSTFGAAPPPPAPVPEPNAHTRVAETQNAQTAERLPARRSAALGVGAGFGLVTGVTPEAMGVGQVFFDAWWGGAGLRPGLRGGACVGASGEIEKGSGSASFVWVASWVEATPVSVRGPGRTVWFPFALLEVGALGARGVNVHNAQGDTRLWTALGLGSRIRWWPIQHVPLFVDAQAAARFPLVRERFYFAPATEIHRVPAVAAAAGLAVGAQFL